MLTIEQLLIPVTTEQQLEDFLLRLEALGLKPRSWREGGALRTILHIIAAVYAGFTTAVLGFVRAGFLETATGGWLTLLAFYGYGVTRIEATFATGTITLTNAGGGVFTGIAPGAASFVSAVTGKAYTNVDVFTLNPGNVLALDVRAVEIGSASSAPPGTVTRLEGAFYGVTVTNAASIVGADAEVDEDLRQRCKDKLGTLSGMGPRGAYAYAVESAVRIDGSPVDINRRRISPSSSTGVVTIYVASSTGAPSASDLEAVRESIELYARPDTVTVTLLAATAVAFTKSITVWAARADGVSAESLATLVGDALLTMIAAYPIGGIAKPPSTQGYLYADGVAGVVKSAHPTIFDVDGIGADVLMNPGEVATLATTLDIRIVEVS